MTGKHIYRTASGLRVALEERLNRLSKENGVDIMRLRRCVAFDRLLARFFAAQPSALLVKGGYALELLFDNARSTKDMDFSFKGDLGNIWTNKKDSDPQKLQGYIQEPFKIEFEEVSFIPPTKSGKPQTIISKL